jgi:hypothetical protein
MKFLDKVKILAFILIVLSVVDLVESWYFLNCYGFEWELNPFVNDNSSLFLSKSIALLMLCIICVIAFHESQRPLEKSKGVRSIILVGLAILNAFLILIIISNLVHIIIANQLKHWVCAL